MESGIGGKRKEDLRSKSSLRDRIASDDSVNESVKYCTIMRNKKRGKKLSCFNLS